MFPLSQHMNVVEVAARETCIQTWLPGRPPARVLHFCVSLLCMADANAKQEGCNNSKENMSDPEEHGQAPLLRFWLLRMKFIINHYPEKSLTQ